MKVQRFVGNPIITPNMDERMGENINGPSLIKVPDWIDDPLGRYYLYFGHHQGDYIRMAYADHLVGPWTIHTPGVLDLDDSFCIGHIASPDVHVDDDDRRIRMYFHGPDEGGGQQTRVALSPNGLRFTARPDILGTFYFRVFEWDGYYYAMVMPGKFYRSKDPLVPFELGPVKFTPDMRHNAVKLDGSTLTVFYSNAHSCPEHIVTSTVDMSQPWNEWQPTEPKSLLFPEMDYEGGHRPRAASERGWAPEREWQLRDPCIYREGDRTYLLYSIAGEHGIALAELFD